MHCTKYFYKNIGGEHFSNLGCFSSHQKIFMKYHHELWKIPICLLILENSSPALVVFSLADLTGWQGTAIGRSNGQTKSDGSWLGQGAAGPGAQTTLARWCPGSPRRPFAGWPRSPDNTSSWDPNPWVVPCQGKTGRRSRLRRYKHTNTTSTFSPNMKNKPCFNVPNLFYTAMALLRPLWVLRLLTDRNTLISNLALS